MARATVIFPKHNPFDAKKMRGVIISTLNGTSKAIKVDMAVPAQTWDRKVKIDIASPSEFTREISTNDDIYAMLEKGTKPHIIRKKGRGILRFKFGFRSKTIPNEIRSRKGAKGTIPAPPMRRVKHPGTAPRLWTKAIKKKWDAQIGVTFQRAIDSAVS